MASHFFVGRKEDIAAYVDNGNSHQIGAESTKDRTRKTEKNASLKIIVVGGGISGLSAAITLSRAGHDVTVLEKSKFKKEAGFMITIGSNAIRVLNSFNFDYRRARSVDCNFVETFNGHTLESLTNQPAKHMAMDDAMSPKTFYRPDLHSELKRIAVLQSGGFKTPTLKLGAKDVKSGTITLEDGTTLIGDLIVGADGEKSLVKKAFEDVSSLRQAPYRILRAIVPTEKLLDDERDRAMMKLTNNKFAIFMSMDRQVSWFEGRDGLLQDLEAGYILSEGEDLETELDPQKAYEKMMTKFKDFHPDIVRALGKADRVSDWEVNFSRPLPHLFKHKAVLVGDAAHSMHPTTGQGGSQSLEDAGCLGILLSNLDSHSEVESRLKLYQEIRKERIGIVQALSGIVYGTEKQFAETRPWHPINKTHIKSPEAHINYIFSYDVIEASRKALAKSFVVKANL